MPSAAEGGNGVAKPFGGIKIESLLQLAAINRENERSNLTSSRSAPLREVLNQPDENRRLVPLSLVSPQQHDVQPTTALTSLLNVLDPKTIALSEPANALEGVHGSPQVRLPGVEDITKRPPKHGKAGVPLAEVLNDESRSPHLSVALPSSRRASISSAGARKRRKLSNAASSGKVHLESSLAKEIVDTGSERKYVGQGITLPKLPDTTLRESKRQGLPPVITGLHDPPEESRLIPSIHTGDGGWQSLQSARHSHEVPYQAHTQPVEEPQLEQTSQDVQHRSRSMSVEEDGQSSGHDDVQDEPVHDDHRANARVAKSSRKAKSYRRWTKEEGENLLKGVKQYGIGNWKRILDDSGLAFHPERSAVDLKDRFRRSYPQEYQKAGESALHERQQTGPDLEPQPASNRARSEKNARDTIDKSETRNGVVNRSAPPPDPAQFKRAARRGRVKFSEEEDAALDLGFIKHGPNWQKILTDPGLNDILGGRKRTDLRDRFRNKWPDRFKAAKTRTGVEHEAPKQIRKAERTASDQKTPIAITKGKTIKPSRGTADQQKERSSSKEMAAASSSTNAAENAAVLSSIISHPPTNLASTLLDDLALDETASSSNAPVFALSRLILDRHDRGAQDRGTPSSVVDLPALSMSVSGAAFSDVQNDSQQRRGSIPTADVPPAGPTGMPLSSMLAGEEDTRDSLIHPGPSGFMSVLGTDQTLPGIGEFEFAV